MYSNRLLRLEFRRPFPKKDDKRSCRSRLLIIVMFEEKRNLCRNRGEEEKVLRRYLVIGLRCPTGVRSLPDKVTINHQETTQTQR